MTAAPKVGVVGSHQCKIFPKNTSISSALLHLIYWPNERNTRLGGQRWEQTKGMHMNTFFLNLKIICKNKLKMKAFLLETFTGITNQTTKFQVSS